MAFKKLVSPAQYPWLTGTFALDIVHTCILTFGFIVIILAEPGCSLFSYHPSLMSLGLMIFVLEAIVQMKDPRSPRNPAWRITIHWVFHTIGLTLALIAFYCIYMNKVELEKFHFVTWHGKFGIATLMVLIVQWNAGWLAKHSVGLSQITGINRITINKIHKFFGVFASMSVAFTVLLGMHSTWFTNMMPNNFLWWGMFALLAIPRLYFFTRKALRIDPWY